MKKIIIMAAVSLFISFILEPSLVRAEIIQLKMGDVFQAKVLEQNDRYLKVLREGMSITYFRDQIERVSVEHPSAQKINPVFSQEKPKVQEKIVVANDGKLENFLYDVKRIEAKVSNDLDQYSGQINQFIDLGQNDEAIKVVIAETKLIDQALKVVGRMPVPAKAQKLHEHMMNYYQSMLETQAAVLKFLADNPEAAQAVEEKTTRMADMEKNFQSELRRLEKSAASTQSQIREVPEKSDSYEEIITEYEDKLQMIQNDNDLLINETRDLIKANKEIQQTSIDLQMEIKKIKEDMIKIISKALEYARQEQKEEFLRYLQSF